MTLKTIAAMALSALLILSAIPVSAKDERKTLLVLGDSIATGYGLPDYSSWGDPKSKESWATLLSSALKLEQVNIAIDGDTINDLIMTANGERFAAEAKTAKYICISIGGNNFLRSFAAMIEDPNAVGNFEASIEKILQSTDGLLDTAFGLIKKKAPDAEIYAETLYNPFMFWDITVEGVGNIADIGNKVIDRYNVFLRKQAAKHGVKVVEVKAEFDKNGGPSWLKAGKATQFSELTREKLDPHPTSAGHRAIYGCYLGAIQSSGTDTTVTEETTAAEETTEITTEITTGTEKPDETTAEITTVTDKPDDGTTDGTTDGGTTARQETDPDVTEPGSKPAELMKIIPMAVLTVMALAVALYAALKPRRK